MSQMADVPAESVQLPADVLNVARRLARRRHTTIAGVIAEALGLEEAYVNSSENRGSQMGVLDGSRFTPLVPLLDQEDVEFRFPWLRFPRDL